MQNKIVRLFQLLTEFNIVGMDNGLGKTEKNNKSRHKIKKKKCFILFALVRNITAWRL